MRGEPFRLSRSAANMSASTPRGSSDGLPEPVQKDNFSNPSQLPDVKTRISRIYSEIESVEDEISVLGAQIRNIEATLKDGGSYLGVSDPDILIEEEMQVRDEKIQLMRLKGHLQEELLQEEKLLPKKHIYASPGIYQATENMLAFGESLIEANLENRVLTLPGGVYFFDEISFGHRIFIREEYDKLREIIFSLVKNEGVRNFVVTGTPGVGKSIFNFYLLYLLRLEGKTVLFYYNEDWYRFSDEGVEVANNMVELVKAGYMKDCSSWLLYDTASEPTLAFQGVTIVTVCPKAARTDEFMKQPKARKLYMDIWTLGELKICRDLVYPHISTEYVDRAYKIAGGDARVAFDTSKVDYYTRAIPSNTWIELWRYQIAVEGLGEELIGTSKFNDKLFHLKVVENTNNSDAVTVWASEYAVTSVFEVLGIKGKDVQKALLTTCLESSQTKAITPAAFEAIFEETACSS